LKHLIVERHYQDNVKVFNIKAPFLVFLAYRYVELGAHSDVEGSLVIDSPALKKIFISDHSRDAFSIENVQPRLDKANINFRFYNPDYRFRTSLSSVMYLELVLSF